MDRHVETGAKVLRFTELGQGGVPVIFVHSLAGNRTHWETALQHLSPGRHAVALDLRGHGDSGSPPEDDWSVAALATDVEAVADAVGLTGAVLVGHSMGGAVIVECARRRPSFVKGLYLVDPVGDSTQIPQDFYHEFTEALRGEGYAGAVTGFWGAILGGARPGVRERVLEDLWKTPREAILGIYEALRAHDIMTPLAGYGGPKRILVTPHNRMPYSLHRLMPEMPREVMGGVSHWLQLDRPDDFDRRLADFLREIR